MKYYPVIENQKQKLHDLCFSKLKEKFIDVTNELINRLEYELDIINKTSLEAIFLIFHDVFQKLNLESHIVQMRALTAYSLVAYLLDISNINPIEFNLSPYVAFGIDDKIKDLELCLNVNIKSTLVLDIISELKKNDSIFSVEQCRLENVNKDGKRVVAAKPGKYYIIPKIDGFLQDDYNNLINELLSNDHINTNHFYEFGLLGTKSLEILEELIKITNVRHSIDICDKQIVDLLINEKYQLFENIPEFGTKFVIDMMKLIKPKDFDDLVKICSLAHGSGAYNNNAEDLIKIGTASLKEVIGSRDDIFDILIEKGFYKKEAFTLMEDIRKGKGNKLTDIYFERFKNIGLPSWFIPSLQKIQYLFPRAHAVSYTLTAVNLLWYKINYNKEFDEITNRLSC